PDADRQVWRGVEIAKEIVGVTDAHKERAVEPAERHCDRWPVTPAWSEDERGPEVNRSEQQATSAEGVIPIAADEHVSVRRPNVRGGAPDKSGAISGPIALAIVVTVLAIEPRAGDVETIAVGSRSRWSGVFVLWRLRDVLMIAFLFGRPVTADPTITL